MMDYVITNPNKKIYIRLDSSGHPETCIKQNAQKFEYSKAKNILHNLPKTLKKFHFKVQAVNGEIINNEQEERDCKEQIFISTYYIVPDCVNRWVDRVKDCNGLAKDAAERKNVLIDALSNVDKELSNCLHIIELTKWKNGCDGYKEYKTVKNILERRRCIKDELTVVQSILESNLQSMASDRIEKVVNRLGNRVFNIREVKDYDFL